MTASFLPRDRYWWSPSDVTRDDCVFAFDLPLIHGMDGECWNDYGKSKEILRYDPISYALKTYQSNI